MLMCTTENRYDFDAYYAKMDDCLTKFPIIPSPLSDHPAGPWVSPVGSARAGAPQEFIDKITRAVRHISHCLNGAMTGMDDLARGEIAFFQGDIHAAESLIASALEHAREHMQFETVHRALYYSLRAAVAQGNGAKAEQVLKDGVPAERK